MNVLIDSSVLIAVHDSDDIHHDRSVKDLVKVGEQESKMWVTEHVLDEVFTILSKRRKTKQIEHLWSLIESSDIRVYVPQSASQAMQIMRQTYNQLINQKQKRASYTDLHQAVLVKNQYLKDTSILSYDRHLMS